MVKPVFDFTHLTIAERIQLAQDLWDSIADAPAMLELTEAQRVELDRRLAAHRADPGDTVPWDAIREELNRAR